MTDATPTAHEIVSMAIDLVVGLSIVDARGPNYDAAVAYTQRALAAHAAQAVAETEQRVRYESAEVFIRMTCADDFAGNWRARIIAALRAGQPGQEQG